MPSPQSGFNLSSHSLRASPQGKCIERILNSALSAVEPYQTLQRFMVRSKDYLHISETTYDLMSYRRIRLIAFGKAAFPMAVAAAEIIGDNLDSGLVITPSLDEPLPALTENLSKKTRPGNTRQDDLLYKVKQHRLKIIKSSHPIPSLKSVSAAQAVIDLISDLTPSDLLICLISGGGSALLAAPAKGTTLEDIQLLTQLLLSCGAPINEINILRKHLDLLKGGGLVRLSGGASIITLILSDVVGDPLDVIASGPTVPDPSTFGAAWDILDHYSILDRVPANIQTVLQSGIDKDLPESPKPGDKIFQNVVNLVVGSNIQAAQAALDRAIVEGFNSMLLTTYLQGEARQVGQFLGSIARQIDASGYPLPRPACLIMGGETTVTVKGDGLGGRNQELALAAVPCLADIPSTILVSMATDGIDGPTDAAGAVVSGETSARSNDLDLNVQEYLARNDAYHFFDCLDDLLKPGVTRTNVNDLMFIFTL
jgi:glycerate 2-kinase